MTPDRTAQLQAIAATLAPELDPARDYPALAAQAERWHEERPLKGLRVLCGTPLFLNTLAQFAALLEGGADLEVVYSDELGYDPAIQGFLAGIGLTAYHGAEEAAACGPFDAVLDCSARNRRTASKYGYCELTRSGVHIYKEEPPERPVFAADSGRIKAIETVLGTGDGCLRGLRHIGVDPAGKTVLLFGYGRVGHGIEHTLKRAGATIRIVDPAQGLVFTPALLQGTDIVVTATGIRDALAPFTQILLESGALLVNMGADDEFGPDIPPERAVNRKLPVNFMLPEPTATRYIDPTLALHNAGIIELIQSVGTSGILTPSAPLEDFILSDVRAAGVINDEIAAMGI